MPAPKVRRNYVPRSNVYNPSSSIKFRKGKSEKQLGRLVKSAVARQDKIAENMKYWFAKPKKWRIINPNCFKMNMGGAVVRGLKPKTNCVVKYIEGVNNTYANGRTTSVKEHLSYLVNTKDPMSTFMLPPRLFGKEAEFHGKELIKVDGENVQILQDKHLLEYIQGQPLRSLLFNDRISGVHPTDLDLPEYKGTTDDPKVMKLIISPSPEIIKKMGGIKKFDMKQFCISYMKILNTYTQYDLDYFASVHLDTDVPHFHVYIRNNDLDGKKVEFMNVDKMRTFREIADKLVVSELTKDPVDYIEDFNLPIPVNYKKAVQDEFKSYIKFKQHINHPVNFIQTFEDIRYSNPEGFINCAKTLLLVKILSAQVNHHNPKTLDQLVGFKKYRALFYQMLKGDNKKYLFNLGFTFKEKKVYYSPKHKIKTDKYLEYSLEDLELLANLSIDDIKKEQGYSAEQVMSDLRSDYNSLGNTLQNIDFNAELEQLYPQDMSKPLSLKEKSTFSKVQKQTKLRVVKQKTFVKSSINQDLLKGLEKSFVKKSDSQTYHKKNNVIQLDKNEETFGKQQTLFEKNNVERSIVKEKEFEKKSLNVEQQKETDLKKNDIIKEKDKKKKKDMKNKETKDNDKDV